MEQIAMEQQVHEEIQQNIQKTREIESEIFKHSEIEKEFLTKECELTKLVLVSEFELSGWNQVSGTATASLQAQHTKLKLQKSNLSKIKIRFSDEIDKFTDECAQFQATVIESSKEMASLVEEKEAEMLNLELKLNTLQNSTTDYIAEILEEIYRSCSVLEDIHNLKIIFATTIGNQVPNTNDSNMRCTDLPLHCTVQCNEDGDGMASISSEITEYLCLDLDCPIKIQTNSHRSGMHGASFNVHAYYDRTVQI